MLHLGRLPAWAMAALAGLALSAASLTGGAAQAQIQTQTAQGGKAGQSGGPAPCTPDTPTCTPRFNLGVSMPINTCKTTDTGSPCAWADTSVAKANFLACPLQTTGPIGLCYYSGVPGAPLNTPSCTLTQGGAAADCQCYQINPGWRGAKYSYILVTSILNKAVYDQTVAACGKDGEKCLNAASLLLSKKTGRPINLPVAPVCTAMAHHSLNPGAQYTSTFSPILAKSKGLTSYTCPTGGGGNVYAGCMTAPCKPNGRTDPSTGLPMMTCTCPTYNGPNQVGNPQIKGPSGGPAMSCTPTPYTWSSAYQASSAAAPPTEP